jgi:hypothetical protein
MSPRKEFLLALFRQLDQKAVPYCVLRNYANIYEDESSDIDLVAEPEQVLRLKDCLAEAALATNHHLVLRALYTNYSYVYWHPEGGFLRIDIETEVRWRVFPILTAKSVVGLRRKEGALYAPHPRHESVILWVAAIWRGHLSERYRSQLMRLYQPLADSKDLQRTFNASFGAVGRKLVGFQARLIDETPGPRLWLAARLSILRNAWRDAPSRRALFGYLVQDVRRFWERLRQPPGISVLYVSCAQPSRNLKDFFQRIQLLYPVEKSEVRSFDLSLPARSRIGGLGLRLRVRRLRALFKGGLFMRFYQLPREGNLQRAVFTLTRCLYPSRAFVWTEDAQFRICLGHVETGFMAEMDPLDGASVSNDRIIQFIAAILERYRLRRKQGRRERGALVVLVAQDASSANAVARGVCTLGGEQERFDRIRCLHWPPQLKREMVLPLPDSDGSIRRARPQDDLPGWRSSMIRVCRTLLLVNFVHWLRVRMLLRRNSLVIVDHSERSHALDLALASRSGAERSRTRAPSLHLRPDLVVVLKTSAAESCSRNIKRSTEGLRRQDTALDQPQFGVARVLEVDSASPPSEIARAILQEIAPIVP